MTLPSFVFLFLSFLTFSTTNANYPPSISRSGTESPRAVANFSLRPIGKDPRFDYGGLGPGRVSPIGNDLSTDYLYLNCSSGTIGGDVFQSNLNTLLSWLSSNATTDNGFNTTTVPADYPSDSVFGLFMCRGDVPPQLCGQCVKKAVQELAFACSSSLQALIWYSKCMVRYSNHSFFSTVDTTPMFTRTNPDNISNEETFTRLLFRTMNKTADEAAHPSSAKKFATSQTNVSGFQTLYCLAQCTQDLLPNDCRSCLDGAIGELPLCCGGKQGGRVLYPSCIVWYVVYRFRRPSWINYTSPSSPLDQEKKKGQSRRMIFIIGTSIISLTLFAFGYYLISSYLIKRKQRKSAKRILREQFGHESVALEPLQFDLAVIEVATNKFSLENRIGRGGFGEVYKGVLDGRQIAVKRLSVSSRQGEKEFKNEVLSIAKLQHRNLVGFIGFCLEDQDKILIYEYVPNKILDYYLFDSERSKLLNWSQRYTIIGGIARGILYLHEHSRLKVIHRDLKPSNILLDENMIPKISDFGLARIVEINQDRGCTINIAGTYGYMSPEYLLLGEFSDKSDVFSFGVMILEIITGKKNANFYERNRIAYRLLNDVWTQWNDDVTLSILDPSIKENYSEIEVIRCIHIGLLSVQPNPNARPTMAEIVSYISSYLIELPSPQEPAFSRLDRQGFAEESSSSQFINGFTPFSINEMSISEFLPR